MIPAAANPIGCSQPLSLRIHCLSEGLNSEKLAMMSEAEFLAGVTGRSDDLSRLVAALRAAGHAFCLIGGLAVNHYVDPVVTLDADFAITAANGVAEGLQAAGFSVEEHEHSINASLPGSRLRIQITINSRYGSFPSRATEAELFGVRLPVGALEDLVQGKLWAATDPQRRASKRAKDEADLVRICESHSRILSLVPRGLFARIDQLRDSL